VKNLAQQKSRYRSSGFDEEKRNEKFTEVFNNPFTLVPRKGLEPPRSYSLVPETSASTNSATWAFQERESLYQKY